MDLSAREACELVGLDDELDMRAAATAGAGASEPSATRQNSRVTALFPATSPKHGEQTYTSG